MCLLFSALYIRDSSAGICPDSENNKWSAIWSPGTCTLRALVLVLAPKAGAVAMKVDEPVCGL